MNKIVKIVFLLAILTSLSASATRICFVASLRMCYASCENARQACYRQSELVSGGPEYNYSCDEDYWVCALECDDDYCYPPAD